MKLNHNIIDVKDNASESESLAEMSIDFGDEYLTMEIKQEVVDISDDSLLDSLSTCTETLLEDGGYTETGYDKQLLSCALCNYRSYNESELQLHVQIHKDDGIHLLQYSADCIDGYKCTSCMFKCVKQSLFVKHLRDHIPDLNCPYCEYTTVNDLDLEKHFVEFHAKRNRFTCDLCNFAASTDAACDYIIHLRMHTGEQPFQCLLCNYITARKTQLIQHYDIHGFNLTNCGLCHIKCICSVDTVVSSAASFECTICYAKFLFKSDLQRHVDHHKTKRFFACEECFYKFKSKSGLSRHMKSHQKKPTVPENLFFCASCSFGTYLKIILITHLKMHQVESA